MWSSSKGRATRPTDARRQRGGVRARVARAVGESAGLPLLIVVASFVAAATLVLTGERRFPYRLDDLCRQPVVARVPFELLNDAKTAEKRRTARQMVPDHYRLNGDLTERIGAEILGLHAAVKAAESFEQFAAANADRWPVDAAVFGKLKPLTDEAGSAQFKAAVELLPKRVVREHLVERPDPPREVRSIAAEVVMDPGDGKPVRVGKERLTYATNQEHVQALAARLIGNEFASDVRRILRGVVIATIAGAADGKLRPVYVFDEAGTRALIERAGQDIEVREPYEPGDVLLRPGRIDGESLGLLKAEHDEYLRQRTTDPALRSQWLKKQIGVVAVVLLVTVGLCAFVLYVQPRVARSATRTFALAVLLTGMLAASRLIVTEASPIWSIGCVTAAAAILTVAYSPAFALGATAMLGVLTVLLLNESVGLLLAFVAVAWVTARTLAEIRTRLKMVQAGAATALAAAGVVFASALTAQQDLGSASMEAALGAVAALMGVSIIFVLLPVIEKAFRIATSMTLLEWADTSNPLLRQLIQKAPGTWQHSHLLGSMAEAAAEEIGANGLLVRVGAYYHDIGKMCKPNYFVENQQARMNAHDGLAPTMSLLVILAHVKDGLALAKEYALPPVLHKFIAEHHGTTVVKYFHAMASQESRASGRREREPSETEFRYPGPKPTIRESAILMLCDSVEGAIRSLHEPTPSRIEGKVHEIVMDRLMDGQMDDCEITMKELSRIQESLVRSLCAIHHGRIAYPKAAPERRPPAHARIA